MPLLQARMLIPAGVPTAYIDAEACAHLCRYAGRRPIDWDSVEIRRYSDGIDDVIVTTGRIHAPRA